MTQHDQWLLQLDPQAQPRHGLAHLPPDCPCPAGAAGTYADIQGEAGGGIKEEEDGGVN